MGYGFSLEQQILITAFAEVNRVVMIDFITATDSSTRYIRTAFSCWVKLMLRLPKKPARLALPI